VLRFDSRDGGSAQVHEQKIEAILILA
jgi:hypothetical protein